MFVPQINSESESLQRIFVSQLNPELESLQRNFCLTNKLLVRNTPALCSSHKSTLSEKHSSVTFVSQINSDSESLQRYVCL